MQEDHAFQASFKLHRKTLLHFFVVFEFYSESKLVPCQEKNKLQPSTQGHCGVCWVIYDVVSPKITPSANSH